MTGRRFARRKAHKSWDMENPYDLGWYFIMVLAHAAAFAKRFSR